MNRRPAMCIRSLLPAIFAAVALTGCGGDRHEAPPPPVAVTTPAETPQPTPTPPAPSSTAPLEAPPAAPAAMMPRSEPPPSESPIVAATPPSPPPETKPPQQQQPDALEWLKESEARRADYERSLAEAKANLESANLAMTTWERNVLALKNPFLARPQLSPEENQAVAGLDGAARVKWADAHLSEVSAARDAAQKALDDLKANPPQN